ncbi:hypothetical protein FUA23_02370 [Neolewinella aurantiaca]|uniref:Uncharacterized protein n=1 Tax=Neolewinella aurantiaca TaxID=2602767 RepID=A0A5C7FK92_9BACT|nr:hypothetical protein [Neolewinella aurantiaca]TXF91093.1 hypothetical protein FUA23_02370 [Neolewinella aurantiaca]
MSYSRLNQYIQLGIFRLEDVCVRVQDGMEGFLRTAALEKASDIEAVFRWLRKRNIRIALISDADYTDTNVLLERLNWGVGEEELIQLVVTSQEKKLNPVRDILEAANLTDGQLAFSVLDTPRLLQCAHFSRVHFNLGVTNGRCSYAELADTPHHALLDGSVQLPNFLLENLPMVNTSIRTMVNTDARLPLLFFPRTLTDFMW